MNDDRAGGPLRTLASMRATLWFRPASLCILAALTGVVIGVTDRHLDLEALEQLPKVDRETLAELLRLASGSMLTVATVTLSVLMLVLSLAAGQASPRTVPELMADPVTQNALGTFLATFVFSVTCLVLFGFDAIEHGGVELVFLVALGLLVMAVKYLVQWIHHVADTLKLNRVIERVHVQTQRVLDRYLERAAASHHAESAQPLARALDVGCERAGYVLLVDEAALAELAERHDLRLELLVSEGDFVHPPLVLMRFSSAQPPSEDVLARLRGAVSLGGERSSHGDPLLGFELLAEIGCRALSSGINDPQSAIACIGYLSSLLARMARIPERDYPCAVSENGRVRFIRPGFDAMLARAVRPLARDGASLAEVGLRLIEGLCDVARSCAPEYLPLLRREAERVLAYGRDALLLEQDRDALERGIERLGAIVRARLAAPA